MTQTHELRQDQGFTLIEILVSITILSLSTLALATLLARSSRQATAASASVYQMAALTEEVGRLGAMPFAALAAGTTCVTVTARPLPHTRCSTITTTSAKTKTVKVVVTPSGNPLLVADSAMFERSISGDAVPPLNTP